MIPAHLHVPEPVCWGRDRSKAWLVLEYLEMGRASPGDAAAWGRDLRRCTAALRKNSGGSAITPSVPRRKSTNILTDWVQFWREYRLGYQLKLARVNGHTGKLQTQGEKLLAHWNLFFRGRTRSPRSCMVTCGAAITILTAGPASAV